MASERTELQYAFLCMSFDLRWLKLSRYVIILQLSLKMLLCPPPPYEQFLKFSWCSNLGSMLEVRTSNFIVYSWRNL